MGKVGNYKVKETIGQGSFGKVKRAKNEKTGDTVAIKIMSKRKIKKQGLVEVVRQEVAHMALIPSHKNVIQLNEVLESDTHIFLVMEYAAQGEVYELVSSKGRQTESQGRIYFHQLLEGLEYVHTQNLCHRDLKLENLLLDGKGQLKVSDFGLSALRSSHHEAKEFAVAGSPNYIAPEILSGRGYSGFVADIWSAGVCLYGLIAGYLPFDEDHNLELLFTKIAHGVMTYPLFFSNELVDLLQRMMTVDPQKRITIKEIWTHPWVSDANTYASETNFVEYSHSQQQILDVIQTIEVPAFTPLVSADNLSMDDEDGEQLSSSPQNSSRRYRFASNSSANSVELNSSVVSSSDVPGNVTPNYLKPRSLFASGSSSGHLEVEGESDKEEEVVEAESDFSEFEELEESDSSNSVKNMPIKGLNAFELLARRTGDAVSSMLSKHTAEEETPRKANQSLTCFHSNLEAKELLSLLERICRSMDGGVFRVRTKVFDTRYLIKLRIYRNKAALCANIQLKEVQGSRIVECYRTKGTVQFYRDWYRDFQQVYARQHRQT